MGYRSTFVTVDENVEWPAWFVKKYADTVFFPASKGHRVIASRLELKAYGKWADLAKDIQRSLEGQEGRRSERPFVFVFLHEDGEIVRCSVSRGKNSSSVRPLIVKAPVPGLSMTRAIAVLRLPVAR